MTQPALSYILSPDQTLNQVVAHAPQTLSVLQRFGLDTCCGGSLSLRVAAERHQLDLDTLLTALAEVMPAA